MKMHKSFKPGEIYLDNNNSRIEAHGGYIYYEDGIYYWYGENKEKTFGKNKTWTYGIKYYSSKDLYNWNDEGYLIEASSDKKDPMFYERRIDRPHILRNDKTGKYVCWIKYSDNSSFAIYESDNFKGPYNLLKRDYQILNKKCGDFDFNFDQDNHPYIFVEVEHRDLLSIRLNDEYTDVVGNPTYHYQNIKPPFTREGVACFKRKGKYYLLTSGMTGYIPNPSQIAISDNIEGPYKSLGDPHIDEKDVSSYNSQISCIFKHHEKDLYIALADRWVPDFKVDALVRDKLMRAVASNFYKEYKATIKEKIWMMKTPMMSKANTSKANYVILPLEFEDDLPMIHWKEEWKIKDE